jgi:hypothetical protein
VLSTPLVEWPPVSVLLYNREPSPVPALNAISRPQLRRQNATVGESTIVARQELARYNEWEPTSTEVVTNSMIITTEMVQSRISGVISARTTRTVLDGINNNGTRGNNNTDNYLSFPTVAGNGSSVRLSPEAVAKWLQGGVTTTTQQSIPPVPPTHFSRQQMEPVIVPIIPTRPRRLTAPDFAACVRLAIQEEGVGRENLLQQDVFHFHATTSGEEKENNNLIWPAMYVSSTSG